MAEEVRSLAERSAKAAKDTELLISDSLNKSKGGRVHLDYVVKAFKGIADSSSRMKMLVDEVNLGSREQMQGIEQVLRAIQRVDQVTQNAAANSEESAATSEQLSAQAETMSGVARQLRAVVEG